MIHNAMSKAILEDAPDGTAGTETAGLSKRGEPQEGNMTHITPAVSLRQLTPRRGRILAPSSTLGPRIHDPVLPRARTRGWEGTNHVLRLTGRSGGQWFSF